MATIKCDFNDLHRLLIITIGFAGTEKVDLASQNYINESIEIRNPKFLSLPL